MSARTICFTGPHFSGQDECPGVALLRIGNATVVSWAPTAKAALVPLLRADPHSNPPLIITRTLDYLQFQQEIINSLGKPVDQLRGRMFQLSTDSIPLPPDLMTQYDIFKLARQKPLEQIYFAVGGPIHHGQTASKVTGYVIL
jgi:hypothetical protein